MIPHCVRVLSIQSHVVSGYVGNKCAVFPLQVLGLDVDPINSVQLSNHTGYGYVKGQFLQPSEFENLLNGLHHNQLDHYSHLLTGYIGSEETLKCIKGIVKKLRSVNPNLIYVCDPVLGDNGRMYVPKECLPLYTEEIIPLTDIITPNQYEAELMSGFKINSFDDALSAINWFHIKGVKTVVISSIELDRDCDEMIGLASTASVSGDHNRYMIKIPKIPAPFTGTGDVFSALFTAWMYHSNNDLKKALENTVATLQSILNRTLIASQQDSTPCHFKRKIELKIVQSCEDIKNPKVSILATPF